MKPQQVKVQNMNKRKAWASVAWVPPHPHLPSSLCQSLPVNPPGRRAPPTQGSWGRICGARPWSRLFTTRLNRPAWTAVRAALQLCGHISPVICPTHRLIHLQHIPSTSMEGASSSKAWELCGVCDKGDGWGRWWEGWWRAGGSVFVSVRVSLTACRLVWVTDFGHGLQCNLKKQSKERKEKRESP